MASNFSVPTTPKGFDDKDHKDKDPNSANEKERNKKDRDPKTKSKRKHKDYKIPHKPKVPSPAAFMEIDSSQIHLSTPKRGNKSPSPLNIQSSPGFSDGECDIDLDQSESHLNNGDSDKDQSNSVMNYDSDDVFDQRPAKIPRRFTSDAEEQAETLTESQSFLRESLDGISSANRLIINGLYDPLVSHAVPIPKADGPVVKNLKWAESAMEFSDIKDLEREKIEKTISTISRVGPKGLAADLRLQMEYAATSNLLGPYCATLDYVVNNEDLDPNKIIEFCRDGLEMGADNLHSIQMKRRENIVFRDEVMGEELKVLIKNKDNFDIDDEHKFVFGPKFLESQTSEMSKSHKYIKSKNSLAQVKNKEYNLKLKKPSRGRGKGFKNSRLNMQSIQTGPGPRNDQPTQPGPSSNFTLPIRGRGAGGYYNSNQQRGYYNYGQKPTKGKGYVNNNTMHINMQNVTQILKVFKLPYNKNEIFNIKEIPSVKHIGARLEYFLSNWKKITHDKFIWELVSGHKIGFFQKPKQLPVRKSPPLNEKCQEHINNLLSNQVIEMATETGIISPIFFKEKENGTLRMILDLKSVNLNVNYVHFKMQSLGDVKNLIELNDYFVTIDIKSAYDSVPIHADDRKFLQFQVNGKTYRYKGWPNGLSEAPRLFTILLKPVNSLLGRLAIKCVMYIDDILVMHKEKETLINQAAFIIKLLTWLGFIINVEKSNVVPSQQTVFLGMHLDSTNMMISLPERKVNNIVHLCKTYTENPFLDARKLAKLIGKLQATRMAVLMGPFYMRNLQKCLIQATHLGGWDQKLCLTTTGKQDLAWWIKNLKSQNGQIFSVNHQSTVRLSTDASMTGWGAHCNGQTAQGKWNLLQQTEHINVLEITAALMGLRSLIKQENIQVILETDNTPTIAYLIKMGGTKNSKMTSISKKIWEWCISHKITLMPVHIPGIENVIADKQSRIFRDFSDWRLSSQTFQKINSRRGPLSMDLFASTWNTQLPQFFTWNNQPDSRGVDALSQPWPKSQAYAFPPFSMIPHVMRKVQRDQSTIVLVTPIWPSQTWYQNLIHMSCRDPLVIPHSPNLLMDINNSPHPLITEERLKLAVWTVSGEKCKVLGYQSRLLKSSLTSIEHQQAWLTTMPGINGLAGVTKRKLIFFKPL